MSSIKYMLTSKSPKIRSGHLSRAQVIAMIATYCRQSDPILANTFTFVIRVRLLS